MKRRRTRGDDSATGIDMAPLIDMVFILLIFFMVTASFTREAAVDVERPRSSAAQAIGASDYLAVTIAADGSVFAGDQRVQPNDRQALGAALRRASTREAVVIPDQSAPSGLLLQVMDACREAGAERVRVAATLR